MAGVALVFLMIGALTQALLEFELVKIFGQRRMEREISKLKDHYIIAIDRSGTLEMVIEEIRIDAQSLLAKVAVGASRIHHQFGIMVLATRRDDQTRFNPTAQEPISFGDYLIVMGEPTQLGKLETLAGQAAPPRS